MSLVLKSKLLEAYEPEVRSPNKGLDPMYTNVIKLNDVN